MQNFKIYLIFSAFIFWVSCTKKEEPINEVASTTSTADLVASAAQSIKQVYVFKLDGVIVPEGSFSVDDPLLAIVLEQLDDNTLVIHGFSSEANYLKFGDSNEYNFSRSLQVEKDLSSYAESSGAIAETEKTGVVPNWYIAYVDQYMLTHFRGPNTGLISARGITTSLFSDFDGTGRYLSTLPSFTGFGNYAFLSTFGMDNKISSFYPSSVISSTDVAFDKSFFRQRMFTRVTNPRTASGSWAINFSGPYISGFNDRASSWMTGGF